MIYVLLTTAIIFVWFFIGNCVPKEYHEQDHVLKCDTMQKVIDWRHSEKETSYNGIPIINHRDMYSGRVEFVKDGGKTIIRQGSPFIGFSYLWIAATAKFITPQERSLPPLSKTHKLGKLNVFWSDDKLDLSELNKPIPKEYKP